MLSTIAKPENYDTTQFEFKYFGKNSVPISNCYEKVAKRRQMERFSKEKPKILVKEVPFEIIQEIKSLRDEASLPITTLSRIFKLSPYIIKQVLNNDERDSAIS